VDWRVPADQGRRYAAVSGDYNPIHLSAWTARPFGFKRPIAHGWWTLARALAELDTDLPASCVIEARFVSPLSLPGTVFFESGPIAGGMGFVVRAAPKQGSRREGAPRRESDGRILEGTVRGR
jgi:acyl dehydratase